MAVFTVSLHYFLRMQLPKRRFFILTGLQLLPDPARPCFDLIPVLFLLPVKIYFYGHLRACRVINYSAYASAGYLV